MPTKTKDPTAKQINKLNKILASKANKRDKELRSILGKPFGNKQRLKEKTSIDFYTKYIDLLDIKIDSNCGITTKYVGEGHNESRIRDAKKANGKNPEKSYHPWLQNLCAQARGASILMDIYEVGKKDRAKAEQAIYDSFKLYKIKLKLLDNDDAETPKKRKKLVQNFSYEMAEVLKKTLPKEVFEEIKIEKLIDQARDFGNFEQTHRNVITLINVNDETIIKSSLKIPPVNDKIKKLYDDDLNNQKWFNKLKGPEKKLVKRYQEKITSGKYILPTQLRYLPGLKNAYLDVFGVAEVKDGKRIELKKENAHFLFQSGTMAYNAGNSKVTDKTARDITHSNVFYANELAKEMTGKDLHIQVLNSTSVLDSTDSNICDLMESAKGVLYDDNYEQKGINFWASFNVPKIMQNIFESLKQKEKKGDIIVWLQCKSGKDRTNLMVDGTQTTILVDDLKNNTNENTLDTLKKAIVESNHALIVATGPGGSKGATGLKLKTLFKRAKNNPFLSGRVIEHWTNTIADINNTELKEPKDDKLTMSKKFKLMKGIISGDKNLIKALDKYSADTNHDETPPKYTNPDKTPTKFSNRKMQKSTTQRQIIASN